MRFLLDVNLAPALVATINAAGHECMHVSSLLSPQAKDREIAAAANSFGAVLVTKDTDFVDLARRGVLAKSRVWLRSGNMSNRQMSRRLLPVLPQIVLAIEAGERIVEVR